MKDFTRFIQAKIKLARRGAPPRAAAAAGRVPPGQHRVQNFPVLDLGLRPRIEPAQWRLRLYGLVEQPLTLDWDAFQGLPQVRLCADFHCVTRWTRLDLDWEGVPGAELVAQARPRPEARFVLLYGADGYTTNLPLAALLDPQTVVAHSVAGAPLTAEHGGPVRLVVPRLYGWKSAKWLQAIEFLAQDRPGFWETRGYHNDADPWREERFGWPGDRKG